MIKIEFNKQTIDRCESKIDFRVHSFIFRFLGLHFYDNGS